MMTSFSSNDIAKLVQNSNEALEAVQAINQISEVARRPLFDLTAPGDQKRVNYDPAYEQISFNTDFNGTDTMTSDYHGRDYIYWPWASQMVRCAEKTTIRWTVTNDTENVNRPIGNNVDISLVYESRNEDWQLVRKKIGEALYDDGYFEWTPECPTEARIPGQTLVEMYSYMVIEPSGVTTPSFDFERHIDCNAITTLASKDEYGYINAAFPSRSYEQCYLEPLYDAKDFWFARTIGHVYVATEADFEKDMSKWNEKFVQTQDPGDFRVMLEDIKGDNRSDVVYPRQVKDIGDRIRLKNTYFANEDVIIPTSLMGVFLIHNSISTLDIKEYAKFFANGKNEADSAPSGAFSGRSINLDIYNHDTLELETPLGDWSVEYAEEVGITSLSILKSMHDNVVSVNFSPTRSAENMNSDDWTHNFKISQHPFHNLKTEFTWKFINADGSKDEVKFPVDPSHVDYEKGVHLGFALEWFLVRRNVIAKLYQLMRDQYKIATDLVVNKIDKKNYTNLRILIGGFSQGGGIASIAAADIHYALKHAEYVSGPNNEYSPDMDINPLFLVTGGGGPLGGLDHVKDTHEAIPMNRRFRFMTHFKYGDYAGIVVPYNPLPFENSSELLGDLDWMGIRQCLYGFPDSREQEDVLGWSYKDNLSYIDNGAMWVEGDLIPSLRSHCPFEEYGFQFVDFSDLDNLNSLGRFMHWMTPAHSTFELYTNPHMYHFDPDAHIHFPNPNGGPLPFQDELGDNKGPYKIRADMKFNSSDGQPQNTRGPFQYKKVLKSDLTAINVQCLDEYDELIDNKIKTFCDVLMYDDGECAVRKVVGMNLIGYGKNNIPILEYERSAEAVDDVATIPGLIHHASSAFSCHNPSFYSWGISLYFNTVNTPVTLQLFNTETDVDPTSHLTRGSVITEEERNAPLPERDVDLTKQWWTPPIQNDDNTENEDEL